MEAIQGVLLQVLLAALIALVVVLLKSATKWLEKKAKEAETEGQVLIFQLLTRLREGIEEIVQEIEQTRAGTLREQVKSGEANEDQLKQLGYEAAQRARSEILSQDEFKILQSKVGDINRNIKTMVESSVLKVKTANSPKRIAS